MFEVDECMGCGSEDVQLLEVFENGNEHFQCSACGSQWTEATFFSPVVKKDKSNEGGA